MSDLNLTLPAFEGMDVDMEWSETPTTKVYPVASGKEQRVHLGPRRREFNVKINLLRSDVTLKTGSFSGSSEVGALVSLHLSASGAFKSWDMADPFISSSVTVRFVEDTFSMRRISMDGDWEAEFRAIEVL